jgi:antitoxin CptB
MALYSRNSEPAAKAFRRFVVWEVTVMDQHPLLDVDARRRRARHRAWQRGLRELDLLLGRFADAHIDSMAEPELLEFERLLDEPDPSLLGWIMAVDEPEATSRLPALARVRHFHGRRAGA